MSWKCVLEAARRSPPAGEQGHPWTAGGDQGHLWTAGAGQGHPWPAGRSVWARVAGGRRADDRVTPGRRAQVRVTFRPPPFPHPYLADDASCGAHNLRTSCSNPQDPTTRTPADLKKPMDLRCVGGGLAMGSA
jgi:hypothetical protein